MNLGDTKSTLSNSTDGSKTNTSNLVQAIHSRAAIDGFKLSPIDFSMSHCLVINLPPISWINYFKQARNIKVTNSGFTAIVSGKWEDNRPYVCSGPLQGKYIFSQIHFHWGEHDDTGSEHAVDGMRYPLEMHVVHFKSDYMSHEEALTKDDGIAIMVHLFAVDEQRNPNLDQLTAVMQFIQSAHSSARLGQIPLAELVRPFDANYYLYWGAVSSALGLHRILWLVSREILPVSTSQLAEFRLLCNLDGKPLQKNSSDPFPLIDRALFLVTPIMHLEDTVFGVSRVPTRAEILQQTSASINIPHAEYKSITGIKLEGPNLWAELSEEMESRTVNIHQEHTIKSNNLNNEFSFKSNFKTNIRPCGKRICSPHVESPYKVGKVLLDSESVEQSCIILDEVNVATNEITSSEVSSSEIKKKVMNHVIKNQRLYEYSFTNTKSSKSLFDIRDSRYNEHSINKLHLTTTRSETRLKNSFYLHETDPSVEETCLILELIPTPSTSSKSLTNFGALSVKQERTRLVPLGDSAESSEATVLGQQINVLANRTEQRPERMKAEYRRKLDATMGVTVPNGVRNSISEIRNKKIEKSSDDSFTETLTQEQYDNFIEVSSISKGKEIHDVNKFRNGLGGTDKEYLPLKVRIKVNEEEIRTEEKYESVITSKKLRKTNLVFESKEDEEKKLLNYNKEKVIDMIRKDEHKRYKPNENTFKGIKNSDFIIENIKVSNGEKDYTNTSNVDETESSQIYDTEFYKETSEHIKEHMLQQKHKVVRVVREAPPPDVKYEANEPMKMRKIKAYYKTPVVYKTIEDRRPHICYIIYEPLASPKLTEILKVPVSNKKVIPHDSRYGNRHVAKTSVPSKPSLDTNDGICPTHPMIHEETESYKKTVDVTVQNKMYSRTRHKRSDKQDFGRKIITAVPLDSRQSVRDSEISFPKPISFILKQKHGSKKGVTLNSTPVSTSKHNLQPVIIENVEQKKSGAKYYITSIKEKTSITTEEKITADSKAAYVVNFPKENNFSVQSSAPENKVETSTILKSNVKYVNLETESMVSESICSSDVKQRTEFEQFSTNKVENDAGKYTYKYRNLNKFDNQEKNILSDHVILDTDEDDNRNVNQEQQNESRESSQKRRSQKSEDNKGYITIMPLEEFKTRRKRNECSEKRKPSKYIKIVTEVVTGTRPDPRKTSVSIKNSIRKEHESESNAVYRVVTCGKNRSEDHNQSNPRKHGVIQDSKNLVREKIKRFKEVNDRKQASKTLTINPLSYSVQSSMSVTVVKPSFKVDMVSSKSENSLTRQPQPYKATKVELNYPEVIVMESNQSESETVSTESTSSENIYEESTTFTSDRNKNIYIKKEIVLKNNIVDKSKESTNNKGESYNKDKQFTNISLSVKETKDISGNETNYVEKVMFEDNVGQIVDTKETVNHQTNHNGLELNSQKLYLNQKAKKLSNKLSESTFMEEDGTIHDTNTITMKNKDNKRDNEQIINTELKSSLIINKNDAVKVDNVSDWHEEQKTNGIPKVKLKTHNSITRIDLVHDDCSSEEINQVQSAHFNKLEETMTIDERLYEDTVSHITEKNTKRVVDSDTKPLRKTVSVIHSKTAPESNGVTHVNSIYEIFHKESMEQENVDSESIVTKSETLEQDGLKQSISFETHKKEIHSISDTDEKTIRLVPKEEIEEHNILIVNRIAKDRLTVLEALPVDGPDSMKKIATDKLNGEGRIFYRVFKQLEPPRSKFYFGNVNPPPIPECYNSNQLCVKRVKDKHFDQRKKRLYVETVEDKKMYALAYTRHKKVIVNKTNTDSAGQNHEIHSKNVELNEKDKDIVVIKEKTESLSNQSFGQDSGEKLRNAVTSNKRNVDTKNGVEDSVLICIRQEKMAAHHIQPTITVDYTKSRDMTASDLDMQQVCVREVDPTTSEVIVERCIIPNKNEEKCLKVSAVKDKGVTSNGKDELRKSSSENLSYPLAKVSVFPLLSKTEMVWMNKSMKQEETSNESLAKPMDAEFDEVEAIKTTIKQIENNKGEKASVTRIDSCSEYHPDTDPLSKVFTTTFSLTWPKKEADTYSGYQSPIRVYPNRYSVREFPKLQFCGHFTCKGQAIIENTGHTIRLTLNRNTDIAVPYLTGGPLFGTYLFEELNFHWGKTDCSGAEHVFEKENRCLEAQFMHYKKAYGSMMKALKHPDGVACISVTFETGGEIDDDFDDIIDGVKKVFNADTRAKFPASAIFKWLKKHLDMSQSYITYPGSLTFRPFCESITWIVIVDAFVFCCQQSGQFRRVLGRDGRPFKNFRKPQHHNDRPIYYVPL